MIHTRMFFYISKEKKKKLVRSAVSIIVCFTMSCAFYITEKRIYPIALSMAKSNASDVVTLMVNEDLLTIIEEEKLDYSDFVNINRNEAGEIVSMETDTVTVNNLKSILTNKVQTSILDINYTDLGIHIGDLTGNMLFTARGPKIPVRLTSISDVEVEMRDEFISAGINQTKHKIEIEVIISVAVALPNKIETVDVETLVPVAETVIVGTVPQVYVSK